MSTYVIVGLDPDGLSRFGLRNIQESDRERVVASYEARGWTYVKAIVEVF